MSFSSLLSSSAIDDTDEFPDTDSAAVSPSERSSDALARCMLNVALTPRLRRLLKAPSRLVLIKTVDEAAARLLERYLAGLDRAPKVEAYTQPNKTGGRLEPQGRSELTTLERGRSVILISQDIERLIIPEALAAADATIEVPRPTAAVVREAIRAVTGKAVRGLHRSDIEGLGILDLISAIRPGLKSRECVANLRRAALIRKLPLLHNNAVPLEKLAVTAPVADWAFDNLRIMGRVNEAKADAAALRFACLEGPPGTGKTTIAAAVARSADWTFVSTSVGAWFASSGGHLGDVIRAARRFFDELALATGPVVGLLDEIDALPNRATMDQDDASWWTPVITFVLTEIDRLRKSGRPVLLLAATNHFDHLDAALVRPGRLEKKVSVLLPDVDDRRRMFANCLGDRISADVFLTLARLAVFATPAQIDSWCRSAIAKAEGENRALELSDLIDLIAPKSNRSPEQDRAVAIHEAGHAIVATELGLPVAEISILSIGDAGGWVKTRLDDTLPTRTDIDNMAVMMLAGRAADTVLGGGANAGATSDIENVNALLRGAMLDMGLYDSLTNAATSDLRNWSQGVSLWSAINSELNRLYEQATEIVGRRRSDIFKLVDVLLVERVVTGARLAEILEADDPEDTEGDLGAPLRPVRRA